MVLIADLAIYSIVLVVNILMMENYKNCQFPLDIMMIILFSSVIWIRIFIWLYLKQVLRWLVKLCLGLGVFCLVVSILSGLVLLILIEVFRPKCMPINLIVIDWIILGIGNFVLVSALALLVLHCIHERLQRQHVQQTLQRAEEIYEKIMDPKFDATVFVRENYDTIDKGKFSKKEEAIFEEHCKTTFEEDQSVLQECDKKECSICLAVFEQGCLIARHPICRHTFHQGCLEPWLKNDLHCPLCKRGTRSSLITQISKKVRGLLSPAASCSPNTQRSRKHSDEVLEVSIMDDNE